MRLLIRREATITLCLLLTVGLLGLLSANLARPRSNPQTKHEQAATAEVSPLNKRNKESSVLSAKTAEVVEVFDGDTIELLFEDGQLEIVRLLGVDTPETIHPTKPEECFGANATAALKTLLTAGDLLIIERDIQARDHYDRLLLYVYRLEDGLFVNEWLVANGFADTSHYDPNRSHEVQLTRARDQAKAQLVGLWGQCDGPNQPI